MRGQGAILDALLFMVIASGAATLMIFVSGLYATSTNDQIMTIYNYEYAGNALIALHYAKDSQGNWFWNELKDKLASETPGEDIEGYLGPGGDAESIWATLKSSSPAGDKTFLCFVGEGIDLPCYGGTEPNSLTVYTSSVKITPGIKVILKLYY